MLSLLLLGLSLLPITTLAQAAASSELGLRLRQLEGRRKALKCTTCNRLVSLRSNWLQQPQRSVPPSKHGSSHVWCA
jgi:hypothetical protein